MEKIYTKGVGSYKNHKVGDTVEVWQFGGNKGKVASIKKIVGFEDKEHNHYILEDEKGNKSYTPKKYIANLSGEFPLMAKGSTVEGGNAYVVNYFKEDTSDIETIVVVANSEEEARDKAYDLVDGFDDVANIEEMSIGQAKSMGLLSKDKFAKGSTVKGIKPIKVKAYGMDKRIVNLTQKAIDFLQEKFPQYRGEEELDSTEPYWDMVDAVRDNFNTDTPTKYGEIGEEIVRMYLAKENKYGNGGGVAVSSESGLAVGTNADLLMNQQYLQYRKGGVIPNQKTDTKFDSYTAVGYAEGFIEAPSTEAEIEAWAYLIATRQAYSLQGWFGRQAESLIGNGIIARDGTIDWDKVYDMSDEQFANGGNTSSGFGYSIGGL